MKLVIDANIIFAMLIRPGKPTDLFFNDELKLFAPELLFQEINNNKNLIIKKSELNKEEIDQFITLIRKRVQVISEEEFVRCRSQAEKICPDPKDIVYFALALSLNCAIWTNEKKLKEQNQIKIYATHDLIYSLNES